MIRKWYDQEGFAYAMQLSEAAPEGVLGLFLGPPPLTGLHLPKEQEQKLRELLVDHGLYNAPALMGQRVLIFEILTEVGLPRERIRDLVSLFQIDWDRR